MASRGTMGPCSGGKMGGAWCVCLWGCASIHGAHSCSFCLSWKTRTNTHRASLPPPLPLILFQYLFIVTLSACVGRLGGDQERGGGCVCVLALASDEPFCLACLSLSCWQRSLQHYSKARRHFKHERDIKKKTLKNKCCLSPKFFHISPVRALKWQYRSHAKWNLTFI